MLNIVGTLIFYIIVVVICFISLGYYEKHRSSKIWLFFTYFFLFLISAIRYDIGNDYSGYVTAINSVLNQFRLGDSLIDAIIIDFFWADVFFVIISWLCSWMSYPFVGYFLLVSIINTYFLYKVCEENNCHRIGVLVFILSGYLFITWDGARQGTAIMIFLYSLRYIEQKNLFKYILCVAFAFLFHKSALFLLPCYLLCYFCLNNWMYVVAIFAIFLAYWSDSIISIQTDALDLLTYGGDYYSKYADSSLATSEGIMSVSYKLRNTFIMGFWTIVLCWLPREKSYLKNLIFFGVIFTLVGNGGLTFLRISWYFFISLVIAVPLSYRSKRTTEIKRLLLNLGFVIVFMLLCRDIYLVQNRGCTPYDTIFSKNFERGYFRPDK